VGSMQSSLSQTPYFGTAQTDFQLYNDEQPIQITGQAINRLSGLPAPNVPLKLGFATRGYRWYRDVTSAGDGSYTYTYNPPPGLAGTLMIWAAHPDVYDQLNQAQATIYRMYASPATGDIKMSKNDVLPFSLTLINPGDQPLTGFNVSFQAYQMQGTNRVPTAKVRGVSLMPTNLIVGANQRPTIRLQVESDLDAPDNVIGVFTLACAEGASTPFTANITLLPAVPLISVISPAVGYVEVSVDRGALVSRQVTLVNRGLKDLLGTSIQPPTNETWMVINLPKAADGTIPLQDLLVGQTNTFTAVFAPPTNTVLGFHQDKFTVRGTNAQAKFDVNLYARITSSQLGAVQFYVDDILGLDVPNAGIRLRNTDLQIELPVAKTDINGLVTVTNLQEGNWSWQVGAPGYSPTVGVVDVVASQTVRVDTRLSRGVVTVNFTVVPVPFTDRYEIRLEQTFETHVPLPVLVLNPTYQHFDNVQPGFEASFIVTAKNEGLVQMENVTFTGSQDAKATFTPLITYVPYLLPQQSIEVPMHVTYMATNTSGPQGNPLIDCLPNPLDFMDIIGPFTEGLRALANAEGRCQKDNTLIMLAGAVAMTMKIVQDLTSVLASIPEQIASYIGCVIGSLLAGLGDGGGGPAAASGSSVQNFQQGGPECFIADTRVFMADGSWKTIDQIRTGDRVKTGLATSAIATVAETMDRMSDKVRRVEFTAARSLATNSVCATDEHLFWVDGRGWVEAAKLRAGDWLFHEDGHRVQVTASMALGQSRRVYTFRLSGDSAFYANGVLVHDLCGWWTPEGPVAGVLRPPVRAMLPTKTSTSY